MNAKKTGHRQELLAFRYELPSDGERRRKIVVKLPGVDNVRTQVQVIGEGGENNLHSHPHTHGWWFVLSGRARFYGDGDEPVAVVEKNGGVLVPRGAKYWFEKDGEDVLELLHIAITEPTADGGVDRVDHRPLTQAIKEVVIIDASGGSA